MFAAADTVRRLPLLMRAGCAVVIVALALAPSVPRELPLLPGGRDVHGACERAVQDGAGTSWTRGALEPVPGPELLSSAWAEPPEALRASDANPQLGGLHPATPVRSRGSLRDAAVQLALSRYVRPPPAMHLSAGARVVLFPQQGPPHA